MHTPGPWKLQFRRTRGIRRWYIQGGAKDSRHVFADLQPMTNKSDEPTPEQAANARLIAAAPDMLDVLKDIVFDAALSEQEAEAEGWLGVEVMRTTVEKARKLIQQAAQCHNE